MSDSKTIRNYVRARLLEKNQTITTWEEVHGYAKGVVPKIISRFAGQEKRPGKGVSLSIIEQLEAETGVKICGDRRS